MKIHFTYQMKRSLPTPFLVLFLISGCSEPSAKQANRTTIPSHMSDYRFVIELPTESGDTLNFVTDTGGGIYPILFESAFDQHGYPYTQMDIQGNTMKAVDWDSVRLEQPFAEMPMFDDQLIVLPMPGFMPKSDGFLGGSFFVKGGVWEFDYISKTISILDTIDWSKRSTNQLPMKISQDAEGNVTGIHPALDIIIEKDTLEVLFDTGGTFLPSEEGRKYFEPEDLKNYSGSYLSSAKIKELHEQHPEWRFVENGSIFNDGSDMIEVPEVQIGNVISENVWFIERPKTNFMKINGKHMDGALGGNGMKDFRVIADYRNLVFEFEREGLK